jgi:hypothetical protein
VSLSIPYSDLKKKNPAGDGGVFHSEHWESSGYPNARTGPGVRSFSIFRISPRTSFSLPRPLADPWALPKTFALRKPARSKISRIWFPWFGNGNGWFHLTFRLTSRKTPPGPMTEP